MKQIKISEPERWKTFIIKEATYNIPEECYSGLCVDAGCNIGDFPINHGNRFDRYICYDVFQENVDQCIDNTKDLDINIEVFKVAVWSHTDVDLPVMAYKPNYTDDLEHFGNSGNIGCIKYAGPAGEGWYIDNTIDIVKTISIDDIINKYGTINLLKIDVEGSEYEFLLNKDLTKINYIVGEIHYRPEFSSKLLIDWISKTHDIHDGYFKLKTK